MKFRQNSSCTVYVISKGILVENGIRSLQMPQNSDQSSNLQVPVYSSFNNFFEERIRDKIYNILYCFWLQRF